MLFRAGFRARTSVQQEKERESTENAVACGSTWREWFAKLDQSGSLWRTRQCSFLEGLEQFSETWPRSGLMQRGQCFPLPNLERRICEKESGLWPTPVKTDGFAVGWCRTSIERKERGETRPSGAHIGTGLKYFRGTEKHLVNGYPNPALTEWLMGWPAKWSDLQPLGMDKFQEWLPQHLPSLRST